MAKKVKKRQEPLKIPNVILITAALLSRISRRALVRFAARLFTTPIRHKMPKREIDMDLNSRQRILAIPAIQKKVMLYELGTGPRRFLLVHGWSGRGTQLVKFAEALAQAGHSVVSFDAPAHGKAPGKTTALPEFIASIMEIEKSHGPFEAAIGHSLGGMSLLNAAARGLAVKKLVIIGSGDVIKDIFDDFVRRLKLDLSVSTDLQKLFEKRYDGVMNDYSSYLSAQKLDIPVLVVHDADDMEVPVPCAHHIQENLKNGQLLITQKLGHRKILGDARVLQDALKFLNIN